MKLSYYRLMRWITRRIEEAADFFLGWQKGVAWFPSLDWEIKIANIYDYKAQPADIDLVIEYEEMMENYFEFFRKI